MRTRWCKNCQRPEGAVLYLGCTSGSTRENAWEEGLASGLCLRHLLRDPRLLDSIRSSAVETGALQPVLLHVGSVTNQLSKQLHPVTGANSFIIRYADAQRCFVGGLGSGITRRLTFVVGRSTWRISCKNLNQQSFEATHHLYNCAFRARVVNMS